MTVFLGNQGRILLSRKGSDQAFISLVDASDISLLPNRFSVDFAHEQFITGDRLELRTTDGSDLNWIDHVDVDDSFTRYVHVDAAGGMRLYNTFSDSVRGNKSNSIPLKIPSESQETSFRVVDGNDDRCLAQITSYQITTSRETIDTTNLGAQFRRQYESGLIDGQGQIECFWDKPDDCACGEGDDLYAGEFSAYLARLCLRLVHGAAFHGLFYIYAEDSGRERSVWYESETCIVTNVAVSVSPDQLVSTTIDFVTSGPITLQEGIIPQFVELEQDEFVIELEGATAGRMQLENTD
jgi:hypothetical protein